MALKRLPNVVFWTGLASGAITILVGAVTAALESRGFANAEVFEQLAQVGIVGAVSCVLLGLTLVVIVVRALVVTWSDLSVPARVGFCLVLLAGSFLAAYLVYWMLGRGMGRIAGD